MKHAFPVFRYFEEKAHAEALCDGFVWLSTFSTCRKYEDPRRGDPDEGSTIYTSTFSEGTGADPRVNHMAQNLGIFVSEKAQVKIGRNVCKTLIKDAYVICTTMTHAPEKMGNTFGKYCVSIENAELFFQDVSTELLKSELFSMSLGQVQYKHRSYLGLQSAPLFPEFIKDPDKYSDQNEFRFLWKPIRMRALSPIGMRVNEVKKLCKMI